MNDRKRIRETIGYTRDGQVANADAWYSGAKGFRAAAEVLNGYGDRIPGDTRPFAFNAALSLELIFKGILIRRNLPVPDGPSGHDLVSLCAKADVNLSDNQKITLELLSETIVWAGRYPAPKTEKRWNEYQDVIFEKHVIRSSTENRFSLMANRDTFPDWENYLKIWNVCVAEFEAVTAR